MIPLAIFRCVKVFSYWLKGHYVVLEKKFKLRIYFFTCFPLLYKQMFSEENEVPELYSKLEVWQGPPNVNKIKQQLCCPSRSVCLFRLFSRENKESLFI